MIVRVGVSPAGRMLLGPRFELTPASALPELSSTGSSTWLQPGVAGSVIGIAQYILPQSIKTVQYVLCWFTTLEAAIELQDGLSDRFLLRASDTYFGGKWD